MTRDEIEKISAVEPYCFETDREERWYKLGCIDGLKAADAEPNLESLWHNASEEPLLEEKEIIFLNKQDIIYISEKLDGIFLYMFEKFSWEKYVDLLEISKWAYIDDLLPKKEIENNN